MKKKLLSLVLVGCMLFGISGQTAEASHKESFTKKKPTTCNFVDPWERTVMVNYVGTSDPYGELCYGFETVAVNEDYVWTRSILYKHQSRIKNSNGTYNSSVKKASSGTAWAKIEVKHASSGQRYTIVFTNVADSEENSDFKFGKVKKSYNKIKKNTKK